MDDFRKMMRMTEVEGSLAEMFGMESATSVAMKQIGKIFGIIMTVRISIGVLAGKTEVNLTETEDEEEALSEWCTEIAGLVTALAMSLKSLSPDEEYGFLRTVGGGQWQFVKVPRLNTEDDVARYLMGENESYGEVVVVGDGLPAAEDMEGWKKLIMMIGNRIFGYIKK